jgi:polyphosphate kinase
MNTIDKQTKRSFDQPSERYINRELSWLAFNMRVIEEAQNPMNPLLERLHFLSISAGNLDEFYMVRVAGLKDHVRDHVHKLSDDGKTPAEQLDLIQARAAELMAAQQNTWNAIRKGLKEEGIVIVKRDELSKSDREWIESYYEENLFPVLTPIAIDPAHPFPFLPNLGIAQIFSLSLNGKEQIAVIPFPQKQNRFIRLPSKTGRKKKNEDVRLVRLEDVIEVCLDSIFPGFEKADSALFRIVRDSDVEVDDEAEDLMRSSERAIKERRRGEVIRVKVIKPISKHLKQFIMEQMHVAEEDVVEVDGMVGLSNLSELYDIARPDLKFPPYKVRFPERINDFGGDCFAAISAKDIVVHHPFESFDVVVQFLRQAARDPDVVSIKQTLYRTSKDSPIVKALIEAAEAGKSVTALVELKARFDEEANIKWARDLERAGAQVVFGFVNLKTHAKVSLVTRRTEGKLRSYVHFGTGNYHPNTAKVYTDLSFFTSDPALCKDAAYLFNFLTGYAPPKELKKLILAPRDLRKGITQLIEDEIAHAKAGRPASIWAKMNALVDVEIIESLYKASQAGVHIELVVRGICCLRPGVPGLSENIQVKSIVGRFLEHARIFCFGAGNMMPSPSAKVYICSADWMPRNFDWRVEAMVPIENPTVHAQIMNQIMMANLKDERNSWILENTGNYRRLPPNPEAFSAHEYFMNNPSLSGRGKALKKAKPSSAIVYKLKK